MNIPDTANSSLLFFSWINALRKSFRNQIFMTRQWFVMGNHHSMQQNIHTYFLEFCKSISRYSVCPSILQLEPLDLWPWFLSRLPWLTACHLYWQLPNTETESQALKLLQLYFKSTSKCNKWLGILPAWINNSDNLIPNLALKSVWENKYD